MKVIYSLLIAVIVSSSVSADDSQQAETWLNRLEQALQTLNFSTSFVVVKNNQAEPYHWFHGRNADNEELEILSLLNGPRRDILRKNNVVSYIEPELPPFSVMSPDLFGPIPAVFRQNIQSLTDTYDFISVGRSRILGRAAQLIRIVSKDPYRYGHWLWLDQKTGMLLKLALISNEGKLLEQIQFTHLDISPELAEGLQQLQNTTLPKVVEIPQGYQSQMLQWQVKWLPKGFKQVNANRHRISAINKPVEFMLFNDGLVDVSVYVNNSDVRQRATDFVMDGATVVLNQVVKGFEVSVVGKVPPEAAKKIADSVVLMTNKAPMQPTPTTPSPKQPAPIPPKQ